MRIAYLDCFSGISGDMFLGALVDAGVDAELLRKTVRELELGAELEVSRVDRWGISATKVDVIVGGVKDLPRELAHSQVHRHADGTTHTHEHGESQEHQHSHTEQKTATAPEHGHQHRGLKEIRHIIGRARISESAKSTAMAVFQALGEAEAKVHNSGIDSIHFHEVGAVDAIVDIVCAAVGAEALGVDEWRCSALNVGSGTVECAHGTLPVPAPATLELLRGAPVYSGAIAKELVTPTGAAIVKTLVKEFGGMPAMKVECCGYGAGARNFESAANVVRVTVGEQVELRSTWADSSAPARAAVDEVAVMEANVDDMTPQVFGYVIDRLLEAGALEAFGTSAQMKKNRPGMLLTVLARPDDAERLSEVIFAETTTIGLRMRRESRRTLKRRFITITTEWGEVNIKIAELNGKVVNAAPEFDDCRKIAVKHKVALKRVMSEAMRIYQQDYLVLESLGKQNG